MWHGGMGAWGQEKGGLSYVCGCVLRPIEIPAHCPLGAQIYSPAQAARAAPSAASAASMANALRELQITLMGAMAPDELDRCGGRGRG